jgi:hypothetical protein
MPRPARGRPCDPRPSRPAHLRVEVRRHLVHEQRLVLPPALPKGHAQVVQRVRVLRVQRQRVLVQGDALGDAALQGVRESEGVGG